MKGTSHYNYGSVHNDLTKDKKGNKESKIQQDPYAYSLLLEVEAEGSSLNLESSSGLLTDPGLAIRSTRRGIYALLSLLSLFHSQDSITAQFNFLKNDIIQSIANLLESPSSVVSLSTMV